jgi:hypothetical protein
MDFALAGLHEACCLGRPKNNEDTKDVERQSQQEISNNDVARQHFQ